MAAIASVKAMINGTEYTLTYNNSTGAYEASITAPTTTSWHQEDHVYPISVVAVDTAGNSATIDATDSTYGDALKLRVKEKVKPAVVFKSPTAGAGLANAAPAITVQLTDSGAGVDLSTFWMKVDGGTAITADKCAQSAITGGYQLTYTPSGLTDGGHTVTAAVSDYDDNVSETASVTFTVDTVPPTLEVTAPANNIFTNVASCIVSGMTNDVTSSPVRLTVNGEEVDVAANGAFSTTITLKEGVNTITIVATDGVGKVTTVTRTVTLDTGVPEFTAVTVTPNPVNCGATYTISVKVSS